MVDWMGTDPSLTHDTCKSSEQQTARLFCWLFTITIFPPSPSSPLPPLPAALHGYSLYLRRVHLVC